MTYTFCEDSFSDLYKDVHGFRPRGHHFYADDTSADEKQQIWDNLLVALDEEIQRVEELRTAAVEDFERLVTQNMEMGSVDRKTAIQWLVDAEGEDFYDYGYMEYLYGVPYGYIEKEFAA